MSDAQVIVLKQLKTHLIDMKRFSTTGLNQQFGFMKDGGALDHRQDQTRRVCFALKVTV